MSSQLEEFLESQAKKNPIGEDSSMFSWEDKGLQESGGAIGGTGILDAIYLNKPSEGTVVVERSVAALIQGRITNLEEEITRLRARIKLFKIASLISLAAVIMLIGEILFLLR